MCKLIKIREMPTVSSPCTTYTMTIQVCFTVTIVACLLLPSLGHFFVPKLIDLTHPYNEETPDSRPSASPLQLEIVHNGTTERGYWYQTERFSGPTHSGTHMDAPCHFVQGKWSIADIPTDRLTADAVVVDITEKTKENRLASLNVTDLLSWEDKNGQIPDNCVLFVRTGWGEYWPDKEKVYGTVTNNVSEYSYPGIEPDAAKWLIKNRKLYGIGIDTPSLDYGPSLYYESHRAFFEQGVYGLENVANLEKLPKTKIIVFVMPMKIKGACGAPCRIMAALNSTTSILNQSTLMMTLICLIIVIFTYQQRVH